MNKSNRETVLQAWVTNEFASDFKSVARRSGRTHVDAMREALAEWAARQRIAEIAASVEIARRVQELERERVPA
jgi:hypothetical protein